MHTGDETELGHPGHVLPGSSSLTHSIKCPGLTYILESINKSINQPINCYSSSLTVKLEYLDSVYFLCLLSHYGPAEKARPVLGLVSHSQTLK